MEDFDGDQTLVGVAAIMTILLVAISIYQEVTMYQLCTKCFIYSN